MKVYVFGNQDLGGDKLALRVAKVLEGKIEGVRFVEVKPQEDLPIEDGEDLILMDVVEGLEEVRWLGGEGLERLVMAPRGTVHDWDVGWQLAYLKKLGKLGEVRVLGIPRGERVDVGRVEKVLEELAFL